MNPQILQSVWIVAPLAGAWIEISISSSISSGSKSSLPSRERGLKLTGYCIGTAQIVSLPSRERGLKSLTHGHKR